MLRVNYQKDANSIFNGDFFYLFLIFILFYFFSLAGFFVPVLQSVFFILIAGLMIFLLFWRFEYAVLLFLGEMLFGQAGHFFEFRDISIRLTLLILLMIAWIIRVLIKKDVLSLYKNKNFLFYVVLLIFLVLAALRGFTFGNDKTTVIRDAISYGFFILLLPLYAFFKTVKTKKQLAALTMVAISGIAIFTLFNLFLYANHFAQVHDNYYWWLRNTLVGKVTDMGDGFFRIVLPSHLWIVPLLLVLISVILNKKNEIKIKNKILLLAILTSLAVIINFSRIYILGLFFGLFFLKIGESWRRWFAAVGMVILIVTLEFMAVYFLTTGKLTGWQVFQGRAQTIFQPEEEMSALTRLRILPDLKNQISRNFWLGAGLGRQVSYLDPQTNQIQKTAHIDWGWLEILLELGFFGLLSYLLFLANIFYLLIKKIKKSIDLEKRFYIGLTAGLASLMFANLTGPFLFHPLGVFYQLIVICFLL